MCRFIRPTCSGCDNPVNVGAIDSCDLMPAGMALWYCPAMELKTVDVVKSGSMCPPPRKKNIRRASGNKIYTHIRAARIEGVPGAKWEFRQGSITEIPYSMRFVNGVPVDKRWVPYPAGISDIPEIMSLVNRLLVDKKWEEMRQDMIEDEKWGWVEFKSLEEKMKGKRKRVEGLLMGCCVVM